MKELIFIMAGALPEETLVEQLQETINEWQKEKTNQNFRKVAVAGSILIAKVQVDEVGGDMDGVEKMLKRMDEHENIHKMMSPPEN